MSSALALQFATDLTLLLLSLLLVTCQALDYRLPTTVSPLQYNLTLQPFFTNLTFSGTASIELNISASHVSSGSTSLFSVSLNKGPDMTIYSADILLSSASNRSLSFASMSYNNISQILTLTYDISQGEVHDLLQDFIGGNGEYLLATLNIKYCALLRNDMKGWYISQYDYNAGTGSNSNVTIYNAVTQFESTDARRAFPGWDEPSFKAVFKITIIAPLAATVLSNMNQIGESAIDSNECYFRSHASVSSACKVVEFAPSPAMSSYLVALVVGDYGSISASIPPNSNVMRDYSLPMSVYFGHDINASQAEFALETAVAILPYYEELFGISFPLPKMDCIALSDFAAGAMENWGLVTYRKTTLLVDMELSSESSLKTVVVDIAHEFAHQWFGNIVTMAWWNDLWLNEGFASFVEYIGTDYSHPEFNIWDQFLLGELSALDVDDSVFTHPIEVTVNDPNEVDSIFDTITYSKGSSVIRMLYEYMGSDAFMSGIESYLEEYQFNNAETYQLWEALGGDNVANMMDTWVLQAGFPLLTVTAKSAKFGEETNVTFEVTQQRMVMQGPSFWVSSESNLLREAGFYDSSTVDEFRNQLWQIPIGIACGADGTALPPVLMTEQEKSIEITRRTGDASANECYMFNHDMNSFYRVMYDETLYAMMLECLEQLSDLSQFAFVDDQYAFLFANYIEPSKYFDLLLNITNMPSIYSTSDPSYVLWRDIVAAMKEVDSLLCELYEHSSEFGVESDKITRYLEYDEVISLFRRFARDLLLPVWNNINKWDYSENDSEDTIYLRSTLATALVRFEDNETIAYGYEVMRDIFVEQNNNDFSDYSKVLNENDEFVGLDANLLQPLFEAALATLDSDILDHLLAAYAQSNTEQQKYILYSLGAVYQDEALLQKAIDFVLSSSVRDSNKMKGLFSLRRCYGRNLVWSNMVADDSVAWNTLASVYGAGFLMSYLTELPDTFASKSGFHSVKNFYYNDSNANLHLTSANTRAANETIELVAVRFEWLENNVNDVYTYLNDFYSQSIASPAPGHKQQSSPPTEVIVVVIVAVVIVVAVCGVAIACRSRLNQKDIKYTRQIQEFNDANFSEIDEIVHGKNKMSDDEDELVMVGVSSDASAGGIAMTGMSGSSRIGGMSPSLGRNGSVGKGMHAGDAGSGSVTEEDEELGAGTNINGSESGVEDVGMGSNMAKSVMSMVKISMGKSGDLNTNMMDDTTDSVR